MMLIMTTVIVLMILTTTIMMMTTMIMITITTASNNLFGYFGIYLKRIAEHTPMYPTLPSQVQGSKQHWTLSTVPAPHTILCFYLFHSGVLLG
jgi:hypothetical protein